MDGKTAVMAGTVVPDGGEVLRRQDVGEDAGWVSVRAVVP